MPFRFAEEKDLPALLALTNAAFQVERFFKLEDRLNPVTLRELFEKGRFLLFEENGIMAASIYLEEHGERFYLGLLSVDPSRQKTGLGTRMMGAAEEFARERGAHFMDLKLVNLRAELPTIYTKLGYVVTGTETFPADSMPVSQPCHFICMTKELGHR
ncbi:GNAT family N-acetyltransferase [Silvibacterium acidisoli]|uniref:GNAT family N-acetyltransferase n=1 Tax=Acidobacteriaceae bacterium ZG23-2 TaxID=2883246 RepID=UPI00406D4B4A